MNERIYKLREQSLRAECRISPERALLLTEFYQGETGRNLSAPVMRACALEYLLARKKIWIGDGELIVGERAPEPKAVPTYPEICLHSSEDLEVLHNRKKVSYKVDDHTRQLYRDIIIPYWQGLTHRDRVMGTMTEDWLRAYRAGLFTEFQEQRAPGHTVCGDKIYRKGFNGLMAEIDQRTAMLDFISDALAYQKSEQLKAMRIAAGALIAFASRYASALEDLAAEETNAERKAELTAMAEICRRVPAHPPRNFHEALQYYWFVHLGVITELNPWDSFNPGRLDQHLLPFYRKGIADGTLTIERARELLQAFWIKFNNHPAPPKVGVTALESNTYTDFALINLGGVNNDGSDAVNELSFLILDVIEEMRLLQPSSMVQVSKKSPDAFLFRALKIVRTGFGQPSVFNTDTIVQQLVRQGKNIEDARRGGASGCVESGAFGTEAYFLTGYFNLVKVLEITLHNGKDPRSGLQIGHETGVPSSFAHINDLLAAFRNQLYHFINIKIRGNNVIEQLFATYMPAPFLSLLIDDCILTGKDYNAGGARYNTSYIQGVGLGSLTDIFSSLNYHVFEQQDISMQAIMESLDADFSGFDHIRKELLNDTPKYGNDDDRADRFAVEIFNMFYDAVDGKPNTRGGCHRINLLPTTCHIYFGSVVSATPDGRKAGEPLSEGISPVQGADRLGPTAVMKSAAKIDHIKTGGTLLNQKFSPQMLATNDDLRKLACLVRSYFSLDGHHVQFNVVTADTLRKAQKEPEKYKNLIVRVAGYSDYFNDLGEDLQNEIIRRTEHQEV